MRAAVLLMLYKLSPRVFGVRKKKLEECVIEPIDDQESDKRPAKLCFYDN